MNSLLKKISITILILLVLGAVSGYWVVETPARVQANGLRELTRVNAVVLSAFDAADLAGLTLTAADAQNPAYLRIRARLVKMQNGLESAYPVRGHYLMMMKGSQIMFVADSAAPGDPFHSEPGVGYEEPPATLTQTIADGATRTTGPYADEFGTYYSVFSALRDADGRAIAYLGTDIEKKAMQDLATRSTVKSGLAALSSILGVALVSILVQRLMARSRRKRERERELARRAEEREKMLMNIGEGVVAFDRSGRVIFANRFAVESVGGTVGAGSVTEQDYWRRWMLVDDQGVPFSTDGPAVTKGDQTAKLDAKSKTTYLRRADGHLFPVVVSLVDVDLGLAEPATVMTFRDITRETEIDRMKSDFINVAVHQLKTPLTALRWSVETLTSDTSPTKFTAEETQTIRDIASVTQILNGLVTSLLNIARVESGRLTVDPQPTDLGELVGAVVRENTATAAEKRQEIIVAISAGLPTVSVDAALVREIVKNLLINAIKYTPQGGRIEVRLETSGDEIVASVKDNGIGIPADEQQRIANKFFRARNAVSTQQDGTGLGLYFAKQIVEVSGGRFWFESAENFGSAFHFSLPLAGSTAKPGQVRLS